MKNTLFNLSPELVCMIGHVHAALEKHINSEQGGIDNSEGGLGAYSCLGDIAQIAEDYITAQIVGEDYLDVYCYEVHDGGEGARELYHALALLAAEYGYAHTDVYAACNTFIDARGIHE